MREFEHETEAKPENAEYVQCEERVDIPKDGQERMKYAINTAKAVKAQLRARKKRRITQLVTLSFAILIVALPNFSVEAADAMSEIPVIGVLCEAVTFRDYHYSSERYRADVSVPEIVESIEDATGRRISTDGAKRINERINTVADDLIAEFEQEAESSEGYANLYVDYEILHTSESYFTLKLITYRGSGSGYEQNYYYTIDISSGNEVKLADIFAEGSDYITPISENIKEQMREQMSGEDSGIMYWVDIAEDDPIYEWSFREIQANRQFYVNADGNVVIAFDEGEVAPMYMGTQEFVIPEYITQGIMKN